MCNDSKVGAHFQYCSGDPIKPQCNACSRKVKKPQETFLVHAGAGYTLQQLYALLCKQISSYQCVTIEAMSDRVRRLVEEEIIQVDDGLRLTYTPLAPQERSLSVPVTPSRPTGQSARPDLRRGLSRQHSVPPLMLDNEIVVPVDSMGEGMIHVVSRLEQSAANHLPVTDQPSSIEFVTRAQLLRDLSLITQELSETLNISHARALTLLSDAKVKWNLRTVIVSSCV